MNQVFENLKKESKRNDVQDNQLIEQDQRLSDVEENIHFVVSQMDNLAHLAEDNQTLREKLSFYAPEDEYF